MIDRVALILPIENPKIIYNLLVALEQDRWDYNPAIQEVNFNLKAENPDIRDLKKLSVFSRAPINPSGTDFYLSGYITPSDVQSDKVLAADVPQYEVKNRWTEFVSDFAQKAEGDLLYALTPSQMSRDSALDMMVNVTFLAEEAFRRNGFDIVRMDKLPVAVRKLIYRNDE